MFDSEDSAYKHNEREHIDEEKCSKCVTYESEEKLLKKELQEKDKLIQTIKELSENVISKNVSLDKENKRLKAALRQSEFEKNTLKKEI